jgi:hypothetical protein
MTLRLAWHIDSNIVILLSHPEDIGHMRLLQLAAIAQLLDRLLGTIPILLVMVGAVASEPIQPSSSFP